MNKHVFLILVAITTLMILVGAAVSKPATPVTDPQDMTFLLDEIKTKFAEENGYCDQQKVKAKPGDIVIRWERDEDGKCRRGVVEVVK